ncbi:MAG: DUF4199 domain-containing protein [Bacteroidota bacterium]
MKISLSIKIGIAAGIINCIAWYLIARSLQYYSFGVEQYRYYTTLLLLLFGISIAIYLERKQKGGFIEFKDAAKSGILYSLTLSIIISAFSFLYYKFIVPDAIDFFISEAKKSMIADKIKEADMPKNIELVTSYFGFFRIFMSTLIMGVIMSLITGGIFRKKNPHPISLN